MFRTRHGHDQGDNIGCIQLSKGPSRRKVSKHIDIRHHFIREHVAAKEIAQKYVRSKANVADTLTKPLPRPSFLTHRNTMLGEKAKPYTYLHTSSMGYIQHAAWDTYIQHAARGTYNMRRLRDNDETSVYAA